LGDTVKGTDLKEEIYLNQQSIIMRYTLFIAIGAVVISLFASCLKDKTYLNLAATQPIVEFGQSAANGVYNPVNGYYGAFPFAADTLNGPAIPAYDTAVALVLASPQVLNDSISVTIEIDTTQISAYNAAEGDSLTLLPANLYVLPQTVIGIGAGFRIGNIPVTIDMGAFPTHHQYALPITIVSATDIEHPGDSVVVSSNSGKFMWLFQR
jgi:hypothetical protein